MTFYRVVGIFGIPKVRRGFQLSAVHGGYRTNTEHIMYCLLYIYIYIYKNVSTKSIYILIILQIKLTKRFKTFKFKISLKVMLLKTRLNELNKRNWT